MASHNRGLYSALIIIRLVHGFCYGLSFDEHLTDQMKKDAAAAAMLYLITPAFSHDFGVLYILLGVIMIVTALIGFCLHGTTDQETFEEFTNLIQLEDNSTTFMYQNSKLATTSIILRSFGSTSLHIALIICLPKLFVYQFDINGGWLFIGTGNSVTDFVCTWIRANLNCK